MIDNKLIIAGAGSGKTKCIVNEAKKIKDAEVLITTYTEANKEEIIKKFKVVPSNITIQTWFSFLLEHGVRPYQSYILDENITGMLLVNSTSAIKYMNGKIPVCYREDDETLRHYLTDDGRIYSDKISKYVYKCNKASSGNVFKRLSQIYTHIFIDEVQDLAGYDLELIKLMMGNKIKVLMVGDPRQVTYLTHHPKKHAKYMDGKIKEYISSELPKKIPCSIDETSLAVSHRNNQQICDFGSRLYPEFVPSKSCACVVCNASRDIYGKGIYLVNPIDIESYLAEKDVTQLRWDRTVKTSSSAIAHNFGRSKGMGFDHVLIYPTEDMHNWLFDNSAALSSEARAKLYVAITRARHSVAFVSHNSSNEFTCYTPT